MLMESFSALLARCHTGGLAWALLLFAIGCGNESGQRMPATELGSAAERLTPAEQWELKSTGLPPARINHALAYDSARGKIVLFGGRTDSEYSTYSLLDDTWEW